MSRAPLQLQQLPDVHRAVEPQLAPPLSLADLAGRLVEVTGLGRCARTSWLAALVARAQVDGETVAWLQVAVDGSGTGHGHLYPPDLQAAGVDVRALAVGMLPDGEGLLRAADILLRSGGFGLVVLDLDSAPRQKGGPLQPSDGQLGRLLGLCQKHGAVLALLTRPAEGQGSEDDAGARLGSLVSLRLHVQRGRPVDGRCAVRAQVVKDKRRGPGRVIEAEWSPPEGVL